MQWTFFPGIYLSIDESVHVYVTSYGRHTSSRNTAARALFVQILQSKSERQFRWLNYHISLDVITQWSGIDYIETPKQS